MRAPKPPTRRASTRGRGTRRGQSRGDATSLHVSRRDLWLFGGGVLVAAGGLVVAWALLSGGIGLGGPTATPPPSRPPALAAGTYSSLSFQPQVTFTIPGGWWIASDSASYFSLQPVESGDVGVHLFRDPQAAAQDAACSLAPEPGVGTLSTELATWIRGRPGLVTSNPRLAEIGGLRGVEIDVRIADGWTASCPFASGLPTVPLFVEPGIGLRWIAVGSERLRLALLDMPGGGTVVVDIDAFEGALWEALLGEATPIVRSLSFAAPGPSAQEPSASP